MSPERIIIENRSSTLLYNAIGYVQHVIAQGRISDNNKSYCYVTVFNSGIAVHAIRNKKSDKFIVIDDPTKESKQE